FVRGDHAKLVRRRLRLEILVELSRDFRLEQIRQRTPAHEVAFLPSGRGSLRVFRDALDFFLDVDLRRPEDDLLTVLVDQLVDDHLAHGHWRIRDRLSRQGRGPSRSWTARFGLDTSEPFMPLYEYRCQKCGHQLEARQKISDAPLLTCPNCGVDAL